MKLLILGGTVFLGRHLVEAALSRGDEVTLFNRGKRDPDLYPDVEKLRGDRDTDLSALVGRRWDAVVDTSGYVPRVVRMSAELLADAVDHYTFISSLSVYSDMSRPGVDESGDVGTLLDPTIEEITGETYGPLKALCEEAVERAMPGRALNVRAGLIVGRYDPSDRFTYWPHRVAQGGEVLAPDSPGYPVQFIDGRDLADWVLQMADTGRSGVYNATGPRDPLSFGELLETSKRVSGSDARLTWVSEEFIAQNGVEPWSDMPLWVPGEDAAGFNAVDFSKAQRDGLTFRPLEETVGDTLEWAASRPGDHSWRAGVSKDREAELLRLWHSSGR